jgi:hypothetical protein
VRPTSRSPVPAVAAYLAAIVVANLLFSAVLDPSAGYSLAAQLGADFAICFGFIGLDMAMRDTLHESWNHDRLFLRMSSLILAGSALSWAVNYAVNAAAADIVIRVASASFLAFAAAGFTDFGVYHSLRRRSAMMRVNVSNLPSAFVDSLVFPLVAFGLPMLWSFFAVEFAAKVLGGLLWSVVLIRRGHFNRSDGFDGTGGDTAPADLIGA